MSTAPSTPILEDAELVARANHWDQRDHAHGPLVGWVICRVDDGPGSLGLHDPVARVTGRDNRRTAQAAALAVVRSGHGVEVHQVRRCGCMLLAGERSLPAERVA